MAKVYLHVGSCGSMLNYMHEYFIQAKIISHTHSTHTHSHNLGKNGASLRQLGFHVGKIFFYIYH